MNKLTKFIFICFISTTITACSGGGGSSTTGSSATSSGGGSTSTGSGSTISLTGAVSKGPVINATVDIYTFNANGTQGSFVVGGITTDANGAWSASIPTTAIGPFMIIATGGTFTDEYTGATVPLGVVPLRGILPAGATSAAITPITDAAVSTIQQMVTDGYASSPANALSTVQTNYVNSIGFDPIATIPPAPANFAGASADELRYAAVLGGISTLANDAYTQLSAGGNTPNRMEIIAQMADDFAADGSIDGYGNAAAPLTVNVGGAAQALNGVFTGGGNLGTAVGTYQTLPTAPASVAGTTVTVTPVDFTATLFVDTTNPVVVAPSNINITVAVGTISVTASNAAITTFLSGATASDNIGVIGGVTHNAPASFPVGTTTVIFSASDAAGNTGTATAAITITAATTGGTTQYSISGTTSGLTGSTTLELRHIFGGLVEVLPISSNGNFTFVTQLNDLYAYQIRSSNPSCVITNDTGTINGLNITNVLVNCDPVNARGWLPTDKGIPLLTKAAGSYNVYVWQTNNPNIPIGNLTFTFSTDGTQGTVTDSTGTINVTTAEGVGAWGILGDLTDVFGEGFLSFLAGEYRFIFGAAHTTAPGTFVATFHNGGLIEGYYIDTAGQEVQFSNATSQYPLAAPAILTSKAGTYKANGYFFVSGPFEFSISNTGVVQYTDPTTCSVKTIAWDGNGDYVANGTIQLFDPATGHRISINTGLSVALGFEFRIGTSNSASIWHIDDTQPVGPVSANLAGTYGLSWCQARLNDITPPVITLPADLYAAYPGTVGAQQWASAATASSSWSSVYVNSFKTSSAVGAANATAYNDYSNSWAPVPNPVAAEWIQLDYTTPVHATGITAYETLNNGFISQVDLIDTYGNPHTVWTGIDTTPTNVLAQFDLNFTATTYLAQSVKIFTTTNAQAGIDAVELRGDSGISNTGAPNSSANVQAYLNGVTATDTVISGSLVDTITVTNDAPIEFPFGTTTVTFTAIDYQGNTSIAVGHVTVAVQDVLPPAITVPSNTTVAATDAQGIGSSSTSVQAFMTAATAIDNVDGTIAAQAINVPTTLSLGAHVIEFQATDSSGNVASLTATLTVADLTPPVIALIGIDPLVVTQGVTYAEPGATASDNVDGNISASININSTAVNTAVAGNYNVTYDVSDSSGNIATQVTRVVQVTAPSPFNPVLAHPSPTTQNFNDIVFANNQFVAVGDVGTIFTSVDGYSAWTPQNSGVTDHLLSTCFDGTTIWVVGKDATAFKALVVSSADGITWQKHTLSITGASDFTHIVCGGNGLLAKTTGNTNFHSLDGTTWAQVSPTQTMTNTYWDANSARYIGWGRAAFNDITQVSTDGINWVNINNTTKPGLDMIWDGTQYVGVGYSSVPSWHGFYTTSADLYTFTSTSNTTAILPDNITFTGVNYIALGVGDMSVSSNLVTWLQDPLFGTLAGRAAVRAVSFNANTIVAVGDAGEIFSSPNTLTLNWTKHKVQLTSNELMQSAYDNVSGVTVVVGKAGTILRSTDLVTWTLSTSNTTNDLFSITWTGSQFVTVGTQGTILTSADGITWVTQTSGTNLAFDSIVSNGSTIIAKSGLSSIRSIDGINWSATNTKVTFTNASTHLIWNNSQFILTTGYDTWSSADGLTWQKLVVAPSASGGLADVAWDGSQYWAISSNGGGLFKSPDALAWSYTNIQVTAFPTSLLWDSLTSQFVITATAYTSFGTTHDTLATSVDSITWTSRLKAPSLNHVMKAGAQFVMVGPNGTVMVSP